MKKLLLILTAFFIFGLPTFAQTADSDGDGVDDTMTHLKNTKN